MKRLILLCAAALWLTAPFALAHSGRTNSEGCHTNRKTGDYHCHGIKSSAPAKAKSKAAAPVAQAPREFTATVQRVTDGDTIIVRTNDFEDIKIRLYGIDAPESKQKGGAEAVAALRPLQGQIVTVTEMDTDRYGRTVGLVELDGVSVNLGLVAQGHAWHYPQYCKQELVCGQIKAAEGEARQKKAGLWAGSPVEPWKWRRK